MKGTVNLFSNVLMLLAIATIAGCTPTSLDSQYDQIKQVIEQHATDFLIPSEAHAVSLSVVFNGQAYSIHQGELTPTQENVPTDDTLYEIASITKTFTGTLVAQAVVDQTLKLDDDIRQYLDGSYENLEFNGQPITVFHLLTHTSGLPSNSKAMDELLKNTRDGDENGVLWREIYGANAKETREGFLSYLAEIELTDAPGTHFNYSNYGTNLTAHILERAYGATYAELLKKFVFSEAGMTDVWLQLKSEDKDRLALGFNQPGEQIPPLPISDVLWGADGGLKTTVSDMAKFMTWHLKEASPAVNVSHRRLHELDTGYWMGYFWWVIDTEGGARSYRHDGGSAGVRNVMIVYPSDNLAIYAVTNKATPEMNGELTQLVRAVREALLATQRQEY